MNFDKRLEQMSREERAERRQFVHYDSAGGVSVDIGAYLRSPLGRAHLRALKGWGYFGSPHNGDGNAR